MEDLASLITRARDGDLDAFAVIMRRFQGAARTRARSVLSDADLVEDAVQEAFISAYRDLAKLREPAAFPGWFGRIVCNCALRFVRGRCVQTISLDDAADLPSGEPDPADATAQNQLRERVLEAIAGLPEGERVVTRLFYLDGCSQADIAERLEVPVTTVNSRLHASRKRLRTAMAAYSPIERATRSKSARRLVPPRFSTSEREAAMALLYNSARRRLLSGDKEVLVRVMTREDIPAMRRLDDEITAGLDEWNAFTPPGGESVPGGPWSTDEWLTQHFEKFERIGNITLLAEDASTGRLVAFADLWAGREPEPFGDSIDVECIDYLRDYFHAGIEIALLEEAEKVARLSGQKALDIGTNTSSGDYPSLRRIGMRLFYEFDFVRCRCKPVPPDWKPDYRLVDVRDLDLSGLIKVAHWSPTDFTHMDDSERAWNAEFSVMGHRVVVELYGPIDEAKEKRLPVPEYPPDDADLHVSPEALTSPEAMSEILRNCALMAGRLGAEEIKLSCPADIELDPSRVDVIDREFGYAWMRKKLD